MSDNTPITPGSGAKVASDEVSYSGDTASVQLVRLVDVSGSEGSKTVTALTQPVSGTVTANAGSGTFAISAASLPLPTGAATAANQGTLSTAIGTTADAAVANGAGGTALGYLRQMKDQMTSSAPSPVVMSLPYQAVAVSQTSKVLGTTGAAGDTLQGIIIQPTGTTVGSVIVYDNATAVYTYPGGTVGADLRPIIVGLGAVSASGAWKVTTPSNATVLALGKFTA